MSLKIINITVPHDYALNINDFSPDENYLMFLVEIVVEFYENIKKYFYILY